MLRTLLKEEIERRDLGVREAAKQIGISHSTIYAVYQGRTLEVDTAYLICKWLGVPLSTAVNEPHSTETASAAIEVLLRKVPELESVFSEALKELNDGNLTPEDFREIIDFAAFKIYKGKEKRNVGTEREAQERNR